MEETYKNQINDLLSQIHNPRALRIVLKYIFYVFSMEADI